MGTGAELVRRLTDEAFIGGNLEVVDELLAEDFVDHDPAGGPGTKEGFRQVAETVVNSLSDRKMEFDDYIDTADGRVVESWAVVSTHTDEAFGLPASGQTVRIRGMELWRCAGGKIVEHWGAIDMSDVMEKSATSG